jgi:hypothetical protein
MKLYIVTILILFVTVVSYAAAPMHAILDADICFSPMWDWKSLPPADLTSDTARIIRHKLAMLAYYKKLGYTHVYYCCLIGGGLNFESGHWTYNHGNYVGGDIARFFRNTKDAIEANGMEMVPLVLGGLSHMDGFIAQDASISEFYDTVHHCSTFGAYRSREHNGMTIPDVPGANHIAYVGNYPAIKNVPADEIVAAGLNIINVNWNRRATGSSSGSRYPKYLHICHDELGYGSACLIAEERAKSFLSSSVTKSDLVARELAYRYKQVQDIISIRGSAIITVMLWGDSFVPADNGQLYGLIGSATDGRGGVLDKIKNDAYIRSSMPQTLYPIATHIIVQPWIYSCPDSFYKISGGPTSGYSHDCRFLKSVQLQFLTRLGFYFVPLCGEDGGQLADAGWIDRCKQTTYEWVRASLFFPSNFAGYSCATWVGRFRETDSGWCENPAYFANIHDPNSLKSSFSAVLLAYCAWTFPDYSQYIKSSSYTPRFFNLCNYKKSRNNLSWIRGIDYDIIPGL